MKVFELEDLLKTIYQHCFGPFCVKDFVKGIRASEEDMRVIFRRIKKKNMRDKDEVSFENAEYVGFMNNLFLLKVNTFFFIKKRKKQS